MSKLSSGGFRPGEMIIMTAGRQTGKSHLMQYMNNWKDMFTVEPAFEVTDSALVDGEQWHTVAVSSSVATWVRSKNKQQWSEHPVRGSHFRSVFDMSERIYLLLALKFS